jgi:hypothetical protein
MFPARSCNAGSSSCYFALFRAIDSADGRRPIVARPFHPELLHDLADQGWAERGGAEWKPRNYLG